MFLKEYNIKSRNIILMYVLTLFEGMLFFLPILALYFDKNLFSVKNVGIIFAVEAIAIAIFEIPTGAISDLFGRKKTLILDFFITLVAVTFLLIGGSMTMFIAYAIFNALARALNSGTDTALIYDSLKEEGKEKYYKKVVGVYYALWPLGASFGAIVGGYLAKISLTTPIVYTFFPLLIALVLVFFLKEPSYHKDENQNMFNHISDAGKVLLKNKQLILLMLGSLVLMAFGESMHLMDSLFFQFKQIPIVYFGYIGAVVFGLSSLGHYLGHGISEKIGNKRTIILVSILSPLLTILAVLFNQFTAAILFALPSVCFGIKNVVFDHLWNSEIDSSHRATLNSINNLVSRIGIAIVAPLVGYFADLYTIGTAFLISSLFLLIAPILFLFIKRS